jgi:hypothetical protein
MADAGSHQLLPERTHSPGPDVGAGGPIVFNRWHNSTGAFEAAKYANGNLALVGSVSAAQIAAISR